MTGSFNTIFQTHSRLKGILQDTAWYLGLNRSFLKNAKDPRILVYHGICPDDPLRFNTLFLKLKKFEAQLRLYKKYFNIVSLDDFYHQRFNNDRFTVCLTFDDGFANNYKYVLPLLEQYQIPATFFITGIQDAGHDILWNDLLSIAYKFGSKKFTFKNEDFYKGKDNKYFSSLNGKGLVDIMRFARFEDKAELIKILTPLKYKAGEDYWLQMTPDQIKTLSQSKWVSIGSHSYYHNDLVILSGDPLTEDLSRSKQFLENVTDKEVKALAFPYGSYTNETVMAAKDTGFTQLLATKFLFPEDANEIALRERFTINPFISNINQMHANTTGKYK